MPKKTTNGGSGDDAAEGRQQGTAGSRDHREERERTGRQLLPLQGDGSRGVTSIMPI